jgi:heat shock protein HslJ
MKKKSLLWISTLLLLMAGCSNDDDLNESLLYNSWKLVSYGNESNTVLKEAEGFEYIISFGPDGTFTGWAYGNQMGGKYKCTGNNISLGHFDITQVYYVDADPDEFFLVHLCDASTYVVNDRELKLYYSKDEYFKFRKIEWVNLWETHIKY